MTKRRSKPDRYKLPFKSEVLRPVADFKARHEKRFKTAIATRQPLWKWCDANRVQMAVTNQSEHWTFSFAGELLAEWWPRTAKFVVYKRYDEGIHVHDWKQVTRLLAVMVESEKRQAAEAENGGEGEVSGVEKETKEMTAG